MDIHQQAYQSFRCLHIVWAAWKEKRRRRMQVDILCVGHFELIVYRILTTTNTNPVWFFLCDFGCQNHTIHQINVKYVYFSMYWSFCYWLFGFLCSKHDLEDDCVMFWVVVTVGYLDAFISCMLVAPHTPTYSGKGIAGGKGSFNSSFKE